MLLNMVPEGNVNVNNFVQSIIQNPAFWVTINSILTATNQKQSTNFVPIASAEILGLEGASHHSAFMGNYPIISHTC